jgi:hypothetical protein
MVAIANLRFRNTMVEADVVRRWMGMLLAALLVASSRGISSAQDKPAKLPTALATSYLPPDTSFAFLVRPAELSVPEMMQPVVDAFDELLKPAKLGISVADIDEFKFVLIGNPNVMQGPPVVVRARQPTDWKTVFGVGGQAKEEVIDGRKLYHVHSNDAYWLPDEKTIVLGELSAVRRTLENPGPKDRATWNERWEQAAKSPLAGFLHVGVLEAFGKEVLGPGAEHEKALATLSTDARYGVLNGNVTTKGLEINAIVATGSKEGSVRVAPALSRVLTQLASMIGSEVPVGEADAEKVREQLGALLGSTQIVTEGKTVTVKATVTPKMLEVFAATARLMAGPQ